MKKQVQRLYKMSDSEVIAFGRMFIGNLENNLSVFTAYDSSINQNFVDQLKADLDAAEQTEDDERVIDQQTQLTDTVNEVLSNCRSHYKLILYFAKKAFPDNNSIRNEFGENDYLAVRKSQPKMIEFMKKLSGTVVKYKTQLLAKSVSQAQIDKTNTLYNQLSETNYQQDIFKKNRSVKNTRRITGLNVFWNKIALISTLSKIIYEHDFKMFKLFLLYSKSASVDNAALSIQPHEIQISIENGIDENSFMKIENTGNTELIFYVADQQLAEPHEQALTLAPQSEEILKADDNSMQTFGKLITCNLTEHTGEFKARLLT